MSVRCTSCGREYDVTLFQFNKTVKCDCGRLLNLQQEQVMDRLQEVCRQYDIKMEQEKIDEIRASSDRIAFLILSSELTKVDIEIEKNKLRELIARMFPEKLYLYDLIFEPRFERLWKQFRGKN